MSQTLTAGITRDRAFELLNEHNKDPFHITHGETVEGTMRYFAREFDPENEDFWASSVCCTTWIGRSMRTTP